MAVIEIDVRDYLDQREWAQLRKEALDELLNERAPKAGHFLSDLIDARAALLANRPGAALVAIERAIAEVREG